LQNWALEIAMSQASVKGQKKSMRSGWKMAAIKRVALIALAGALIRIALLETIKVKHFSLIQLVGLPEMAVISATVLYGNELIKSKYRMLFGVVCFMLLSVILLGSSNPIFGLFFMLRSYGFL
jgi:hypothetical protein